VSAAVRRFAGGTPATTVDQPFWKGFDCPPAISTREIRFDGSSAILASAIKIDVERLKNSPRRFNSFTVADKSGRDGGCAFSAGQVNRVSGRIVDS